MKKLPIDEKIERLVRLHNERKAVREFKTMSFDLKEECEAYYNREINALLSDPYVYDKWYGMQNGGIV